MSALGTKQTSPSALHMSAFDPKRTCQRQKLMNDLMQLKAY
jgi:hypothetical protein